MAKTTTSSKRFTRKIIVEKSFPPKWPIGMSTKESQLKSEPKAVALRKTFQHNEHTYASTDSSVLLCPSCNFQTISGSIEDHQKHHEQKFGLQCLLCSYSDNGKASSGPLGSSSLMDSHIQKEQLITVDVASSSSSRQTRQGKNRKEQVLPIQKKMRHKQRTYRCDVCLFKSIKEKELEKHRQFHVSKSKHQCNRCSYSASFPQHLSAHMRNHNPNLEQVVSETPSGADDIPQGKRVKLHHDENGEAAKSITLTVDLVQDPPPIEPRNLDEEERSCGEQMTQLEEAGHHVYNNYANDDTSSPSPEPEEVATLVIDTPTVQPRDLVEEERSLSEEKSSLPQPEKAAGIPPLDELELDQPPNEPGYMEKEKSSRDQHHVTVATSPSPEPENFPPKAATPTDLVAMVADPSPIKPRSLVEEETHDVRPLQETEQAAILPKDDLIPDEPSIESGNVVKEETSCRELLYLQGSEATSLSPDPDEVAGPNILVPHSTPIQQRNLDEGERSCREQLAQLEEAYQSDGQSLENSLQQLKELEERTQSLRQKIETAKKDEQFKEKMFKDLLLNKSEVEEQKKETKIKKMKLEFELRTEQCKALELDLIELDAVEEDHQERVTLAKKKVESLEEELGEIEKEVAELDGQIEAVKEDLVDAEECYVRASRSLSALKTELEALESSWKVEANSLNLLVDLLKEKIHIYHELVDQLLEIELEKKSENLSKQKANLLLYLKTQFDDDCID